MLKISLKNMFSDFKDIIPMGFSNIYIYIRYLDEDMGRSEPPWVSMRLVMVIYDDLDDLGGTQIMT